MSLEPEQILRRLKWLALFATLAASALALAWGVRVAVGVAVGGTLALVNYGALIWAVDGALSSSRSAPRLWAVPGFALRYALLALALYVILARWKVSALAIIVGFSAPVVALFVEWGIQIYVMLLDPTRPAEHRE